MYYKCSSSIIASRSTVAMSVLHLLSANHCHKCTPIPADLHDGKATLLLRYSHDVTVTDVGAAGKPSASHASGSMSITHPFATSASR